jgi:VanZ family protein
MENTRQHIALTALCLYLAALAFLCFANPQDYPSTDFTLWGLPVDKIAHFLMFAPYPVLAFITIDRHSARLFRRLSILFLVLASGCALAIGTELVQGMTEYRSFELWDFAADTAGMFASTCALIIYTLLTDRKRHSNE